MWLRLSTQERQWERTALCFSNKEKETATTSPSKRKLDPADIEEPERVSSPETSPVKKAKAATAMRAANALRKTWYLDESGDSDPDL